LDRMTSTRAKPNDSTPLPEDDPVCYSRSPMTERSRRFLKIAFVVVVGLVALRSAAHGQGRGAATAQAPWLIKSGDSVFFVGNSFFGYGNRVLPDWVAAIGKAVQPPVTINTGSHIVFGTMPLAWFFKQSASQDAIKSRKYKIFVLQGEEREPVEHKAEFQQ